MYLNHRLIEFLFQSNEKLSKHKLTKWTLQLVRETERETERKKQRKKHKFNGNDWYFIIIHTPA